MNPTIEKHILKYSKLKKATEKYNDLVKQLEEEKEELKKLFIMNDLQDDGYTFEKDGQEISFKFKITKQKRVDVAKIPATEKAKYITESDVWRVVLREF